MLLVLQLVILLLCVVMVKCCLALCWCITLMWGLSPFLFSSVQMGLLRLSAALLSLFTACGVLYDFQAPLLPLCRHVCV